MKKQILQHFKRRLESLKQKKIKTIIRYTNLVQETIPVGRSEVFLQSRINLIDQERIQLEKRIERLKMQDDYFEGLQSTGKRPVAVNEKGSNIYNQLSDEQLCFNNLAKDDIEVYLRSLLFENKTQRKMWKLIYQIKWLHYQKRAEIFDRAYGYVHESYKRESKKVGDVYMHLIAELEAVINQKYLTVAADLKQAVSGLFNPIKHFIHDQDEYQNFDNRFEIPPYFPST